MKPGIRGATRYGALAFLSVLLTMSGLVRSQTDPGVESLPVDDIVLGVSLGGTPGEIVLNWTGGLPVFTVYSASSPVAVVSQGNAIGVTGSPDWTDLPLPVAIVYYQVRGTGCASDAGCPTGHCVDSYCCDAACDSACQACDVSGAEGTCISIATGEDPDDECGPSAACDGAGTCLLLDGVACSDARECLSAVCGKFYLDADGDGHGAAGGALVHLCGPLPPPGYSDTDTDCNDANASINPAASEIVGDEIDQDCNGQELCFVDADGDGFRVSATVLSSDGDCADPGEARATIPAGDCNDANASINPAATEIVGDEVDQNCDLRELCFANADGDGFRGSTTVLSVDTDCIDPGEARASVPAGDCNDSNPSINPAATEIAGDEIDQDCNGLEICFVNADGDGFRVSTTVPSSDSDCADPGEARASVPAGDCNDANASVNPGASEIAGDEIDQNCDLRENCFRNADGDGFRLTTIVSSVDTDCIDPGEARASLPAGDCCDSDSLVFPGQSAYFPSAGGCGTFDYNCDGGATLQFPTLSGGTIACHGSPPACIADPGLGWVTAVPACGASGSFRDCNMTSCSTVTVTRTQACR